MKAHWLMCSTTMHAASMILVHMDVHNGAKSELRIGYWKLSSSQGLQPWHGWCQCYLLGISAMKGHWLMCKSTHTTALMLCIDFHNDAKAELRIGYWNVSFCEWLKPWFGWCWWCPSGFSTMNAHCIVCKPMHTTSLIRHMDFHNDAMFELRSGYWNLSYFCRGS